LSRSLCALTGLGIAVADLPNVFGRFHRNTDGQDGATGLVLGLYICRVIAEHHGGRISVTSPGINQGTTFHIVLPAMAPDVATEGGI